MNRGEVWLINFEPSIGGEIKKQRPAIIVSNNSSNKYLNRIQVVLLTSNMNRIFPSEASVTFDNKQNKAMADQITTVSKKRLIRKIGKISKKDMFKVEGAIKVQLNLFSPLPIYSQISC